MLKEKIKDLMDHLSGDAGVIIKNINTGESIRFNENMIFPSASVIKLPIIYELFKRVELKKVSLDDEVVLKESDKVVGSGVLKELHNGLKLSIKDIATLMIILSDNVATNILIDLLGMENINQSSKDIGMKDTILQRKMMDKEGKKKGIDNFISPIDTLNILKEFLYGDHLTKESREKIIDILKRQQCNNKLPVLMDKGLGFAHKTGELKGVEHDVGILFLENMKIIIVVLTKNLRDHSEGIEFNNNIGKIVYDYFK